MNDLTRDSLESSSHSVEECAFAAMPDDTSDDQPKGKTSLLARFLGLLSF